MIVWTDSHCHLQDPAFASDRAEVVQRALDAGVQGVITQGVDVASSEEGIALARRWPQVKAAAGIHPQEVAGAGPQDDRRLEQLLGLPEVVAVGEIGLDLVHSEADVTVQQEWLLRQVEMAVTRDLPVCLHVREAYPLLRQTLAPYRGRLRGVLHCFTGDVAEAGWWLDFGLYISLSGIVTFPRAQVLREVARYVPRDRLLLETDAPYLAPVPYRGRRNEPAYVAATGALVAELRREDVGELAQATGENARRLFRLPSPSDPDQGAAPTGR